MRISIQTVADCIVGNPASRRRLLLALKHGEPDKMRPNQIYYQQVMQMIRGAHTGKISRGDLPDMARQLEEEAAALPTAPAAERLRNNARALRDYGKRLLYLDFEILPRSPAHFPSGVPRISVGTSPDLLVRFDGRKRYVLLDFSLRGLSSAIRDVVLQGTYEGARCADSKAIPSDVVMYHVAAGTSYEGARLGSVVRGEIKSVCACFATL